jgi:hypothetical protein
MVAWGLISNSCVPKNTEPKVARKLKKIMSENRVLKKDSLLLLLLNYFRIDIFDLYDCR